MEAVYTKDVPYIVHEGTVDRLERIIRRMWILCIVMFVAFVASNAVWIWYEGQFVDTTTITQEVSADSSSHAVVSGVGDIYGSENKADDN